MRSPLRGTRSAAYACRGRCLGVDFVVPVRQRDRVEKKERLVLLRADPLQRVSLNDVLRVDGTDALTGVTRQIKRHPVTVRKRRKVRVRVPLPVVADLVSEAFSASCRSYQTSQYLTRRRS